MTPRYMTSGFNPNGASLIRDCVGRGLLLAEPHGEYNLGHLSHQEFLAGKYLHRYHDTEQLVAHLGIEWWSRPLIFYASLTGDISGLLRKLTTEQRDEHRTQLRHLMSVAEDTPRGVL